MSLSKLVFNFLNRLMIIMTQLSIYKYKHFCCEHLERFSNPHQKQVVYSNHSKSLTKKRLTL